MWPQKERYPNNNALVQTFSQPNPNELLVGCNMDFMNDNIEKQRSSFTFPKIITIASSADVK